MMTDKEILAGAPDGATHVEMHNSGNVNCYIKYDEGSISVFNIEWIPANRKPLGNCWFIRSLADIRALVEKDDRIKELECTIKNLTDGVTHFYKTRGDINPLIEAYIKGVDIKAKQLREGVQP